MASNMAMRLNTVLTGAPSSADPDVARTGYIRSITVGSFTGYNTMSWAVYDNPSTQANAADHANAQYQYVALGGFQLIGVPEAAGASSVGLTVEFFSNARAPICGVRSRAGSYANTFTGSAGYITTSAQLSAATNTGFEYSGLTLWRYSTNINLTTENRFYLITMAETAADPNPSVGYFGSTDNHTKFVYGTVRDYDGQYISGATITVAS